MTTGSNIDNQLTTVMCLYNGAPLTTASSGLYRTRFWSGSDDPVKGLPNRAYSEHQYYVSKVVGSKGRLREVSVPRTYRVYNRDRHDRGLHPYVAQFEKRVMPVGVYTSDQYRLSTGALLNSNVYSNTPISLFIGSADLAPTPVFQPEDQYRIISRLRSQMVGTPFNFAVSLGETREVVDMIGSTARKLAKSALLLKKGKFKQASQALADPRSNSAAKKYGSDPYLQVTYGWSPLLSDIRNGAEYLSHAANVPWSQRYTAKVSAHGNIYDGFRGNIVPARKWSASGYSVLTRKVVAYVSERPGEWGILGFSDPLSIVWELTPYSFVVDWVAPVGDWLEARASASILQGKFVQTDMLRKVVRGPFESIFDDPGSDTRSIIRGTKNGSSLEKVYVSRSILSSLDVEMPNQKSLRTDLSWRHAMSGIALMISAFKR